MMQTVRSLFALARRLAGFLTPRRLTAQIVLLALAGLIVSLMVAFALAFIDRRDAFDDVLHDQAGDAMVGAISVLNAAPREMHTTLARRLSTPSMTFTTGEPQARRTRKGNRRLAKLAAYIQSEAGEQISRINVRYATPGQRDWRRRRSPIIVLSAKLATGPWINARYRFRGTPMKFGLAFAGLLASFVAFVALGVMWLVRRAMKPVRRLADSATAFGRGETLDELPLEGPADIRNLTAAFNTMQRRIRHFVDDRTAMLAAISHDLRTPITALRIRAEMVEDEEMRTRMIEQLDDMQKMTEATLRFARDDGREEAMKPCDLVALVAGIADNMVHMGHDVVFSQKDERGERREEIGFFGREVALRRAIGNLIENACTYGKRADVQLMQDEETIVLTIDDRGAGIPPDEVARMFEPFTRLEGSRSRATGGSGLGLAIARSIARAHGGDITLTNRPEGGLRARLSLPRH